MSSLLEESVPQRNTVAQRPVGPETRSFGRLIGGQQTDLVITQYSNRTLIILTQLRKLGTVVQIFRDTTRNPVEGGSGRPVYTINNLLGKESEEVHLLARMLAEKLVIKKPVILTVAAKDLDQEKIKALSEFVIEKY